MLECISTVMVVTFAYYYAVVWQHAATQPHNKQRRNFTESFNVNITLARFSAGSLMMMVEDRNM